MMKEKRCGMECKLIDYSEINGRVCRVKKIEINKKATQFVG